MSDPKVLLNADLARQVSKGEAQLLVVPHEGLVFVHLAAHQLNLSPHQGVGFITDPSHRGDGLPGGARVEWHRGRVSRLTTHHNDGSADA